MSERSERTGRRGARYDGIAEWYDDELGWYATRPGGPGHVLADLLGPGEGLVLDVGCGGGRSAMALAAVGRTVGGVDESTDQLGLARRRCAWTVRADAARLPFGDATVPHAVLSLVHTDVDDYAPVVREVARALAPGGTLVHLGVHPCFVGHHVESVTRRDDHLTVVPGYRDAGWVHQHENFGPGVRGRIGARHATLAEVLNALVAPGLRIEAVREEGEHLVPWMLGVRLTKPA